MNYLSMQPRSLLKIIKVKLTDDILENIQLETLEEISICRYFNANLSNFCFIYILMFANKGCFNSDISNIPVLSSFEKFKENPISNNHFL